MPREWGIFGGLIFRPSDVSQGYSLGGRQRCGLSLSVLQQLVYIETKCTPQAISQLDSKQSLAVARPAIPLVECSLQLLISRLIGLPAFSYGTEITYCVLMCR